MNSETIKAIPKVELHCHLDGSISLPALHKLAGGRKIQPSSVKAPVPCQSLAQYLTCFDTVLPLLQTKENLSLAAYDVIRQAAEENVIYMEVRFAPAFHCTRGLTEEDACRAVLEGLQQGEQDFHVKSRAILCMMRGISQEQNQRTLECARVLQNSGVAALDLAGNEADYPTILYQDLFAKAAEYGIPFTIHAGECGSAQNVKDAVNMGAGRIGHGVAAADCQPVLELCRQQHICFEMCPISNLQTKAVSDLQAYPLLPMLNSGMAVTVNTDNRTVSDTTLTKEWLTLCRQFPEITAETILQCGIHAAEAAFLPDREKDELIERIRNWSPQD